MMTSQDWPGLYMAAALAREGLLSAVVVEQEALDGARFSLRGFRRAMTIAGVRPAVQRSSAFGTV